MKKHKRLHIVPDKLFKKIWEDAAKYEDEREYLNDLTLVTSDKYINFKKVCGLDIIKTSDMLREIYKLRHLSLMKIAELRNLRKIDISNTFCIPYRTVEAWMTGINKCPPYIRLMILRHYYLINLGRWVVLESDIKRKESKPRIYKSKKEKQENIKTVTKQEIEPENTKHPLTKEPNNEAPLPRAKGNNISYADMDDATFDFMLAHIRSKKFKAKTIEENRKTTKAKENTTNDRISTALSRFTNDSHIKDAIKKIEEGEDERERLENEKEDGKPTQTNEDVYWTLID